MKRRTVIRMMSYCAAAALAAVGYAVKANQKAEQYKLQIETTYSHMLDGLDESMSNISVLLKKAEYTTEPRQMTNMAAQLLTQAESAKTALSQLPTGGNELKVINRFLSQVGNYALTMSKSVVAGEELAADYPTNISALQETAEKISHAVGEASITYNNVDAWSREIGRRLDEEVPDDSFAGSVSQLEESLTDYPTLVYDGPYSDHILEKEPLMIKDAAPVSQGKALETAAAVAGVEEDDLSMEGELDGRIACYRFDGEGVSVTVSKQGGYAVYMRKSRSMGDSILEYRQALDKAERYLERIGMTGFTETYYYTDEGVCVINFAYLDGKTICYTDLVKVGVAMDTGEIMLYEASGYLTNHSDRAFETPAATEEEAAEKVSDRLTIKETALALIPTDSAGEVRCYEFVCETSDGQEILVYINAMNLAEEDILILLKSDGGTLTK